MSVRAMAWVVGQDVRNPLSTQWTAITGERPPTAQHYAARGLLWFEYYGGDARAVAGSDKLRGLASVAQQAKATGQELLPDNESIAAPHVIPLGKARRVRERAGDLA